MKKKITWMLSILLVMIFSFQVVIANTSENLPKFVDHAQVLSKDKGEKLNETLQKISKQQKMDVVIVTTNDRKGKTPTQYADDYFDDNGYGQGSNHDGILLLIDMQNRKWAISTKGEGIRAFTDAGQTYIVQQCSSYLSDGKYEKAFYKFADLSEEFIIQARKGKPFDQNNLPKHVSFFVYIIEVVVCFVIALCIGWYRKSKLKTVVKQADALDYMESGSMNMVNSRDVFLNKMITTRVIPKNTSNGGSSTHQSSSGRTHGGSSGSF